MPPACWPISAPRSSRSKGRGGWTSRAAVRSPGVYPDNAPGDDPWNRISTFNLLNRGKKSVALDLRRPEGREVLTDLIRVSDVLTENFTPRVMRGWELDYPQRGETQPEADHGVVQRLSAAAARMRNTRPRRPRRKRRTGWPMSPAIAATCRRRPASPLSISSPPGRWSWAPRWGCATGIVSARASGSMSAMYQLGCTMVAERILDWEANKRLGERIGNRHPWLAPQGCYRCAGDDAVVRRLGARRRGMGGAVPGDRPAGAGAGCAFRQQRRAHAEP